jgi:hypothetical protein
MSYLFEHLDFDDLLNQAAQALNLPWVGTLSVNTHLLHKNIKN